MLIRLFQIMARRFGKRYNYDASYMEALAAAKPTAFVKLAMLTAFTQDRFGLPAAPYFAAKFIAARIAGCGPCAMLVVNMAEEAGVTRAQLASIARPGPADHGMRLAADYAAGVLKGSPELESLNDKVVETFGEKGRMGLAAAIASGQFFPIFKRGMGAATSCAILPAEFQDAS